MMHRMEYRRDGQLLLNTQEAAAAQSSSAADGGDCESAAPGMLQAPETAPNGASAAASQAPHLSAVLLPHLPLLDSLLQDARSICSLMCTDKELLALLKSRCIGRLPLVFRARDSAHERQLAQWLAGPRSCGCALLAGHVELQLLRQVKIPHGSWAEVSGQHAAEAAGWEDGGARRPPALQTEHLQEGAAGADAARSSPSRDKEDAAISSGLLLQALQAATQVTSLSLMRDCCTRFAACSSAMQALAGLTRLRRISISSWDFAVCPAPLFEALQGLSCLTSLAVSRVAGTSKLRYLPQGLLSLDLGVCSNGICLTHLTQLTALRTDKLFSLESGDLLPASLRQLEIGEINSVQRLVGLTALRSLSAYASNVPQLRLHRVARSLSRLTRVQLCYKSGANEAAAAWPLLPLQHLELQEVDALTTAALQLTTLQQISCLTKLTYLHLQRLDSVQAGTWEIASVLRHLTQLRGLRLWAAGPWPQHRGQQQQQQQQHAAPAAALMAGTTGVCMVDPTQPDADSPAGVSEGCAWSVQRVQQQVEARERPQSTAAGGDADVAAAANSAVGAAAAAGSQGCCKASLTAVIAALPHLNRLSLSLQGLGTSAAAELGAATGLTWLKLRACGIDSAALAGLASELKGLRSLFVEYNREVGDEVLPVLLRELTALTELDVRYTGVSGAGGQHLQTMTRLQQLQL